jgi:GT2 family glycosyltransferase
MGWLRGFSRRVGERVDRRTKRISALERRVAQLEAEQLVGSSTSSHSHLRLSPSAGAGGAGDEALCKVRLAAEAQAELAEFLASGARLSCHRAGKVPEVSVVVALWNKAHFTLRCLQALLQQQGPSFEIILVDNASTDETSELLARLDGCLILKNTVNEGFLIACNQGAAAARGRALLLLNSDAFVRPNALANALDALDADPSVGAVGGRLILPSGRLQEAGGIVWSDAQTHGYGRGLEPEADEAMFRREVDYCSGAFLMTRLAAWRELGGFDEIYAPGYYEEADYCMRLRQAGYSVVFEPSVAVDHYEFGSEAKAGDAVTVSRRNRKIFRERYAETLRLAHFPASAANLLQARERPKPGRLRRVLLVVDDLRRQSLPQLGPSGIAGLEQLAQSSTLTVFVIHPKEASWGEVRNQVVRDVEVMFCGESDGPTLGLTRLLETREGHYDGVFAVEPSCVSVLRTVEQKIDYALEGIPVVLGRDRSRVSIEADAGTITVRSGLGLHATEFQAG